MRQKYHKWRTFGVFLFSCDASLVQYMAFIWMAQICGRHVSWKWKHSNYSSFLFFILKHIHRGKKCHGSQSSLARFVWDESSILCVTGLPNMVATIPKPFDGSHVCSLCLSYCNHGFSCFGFSRLPILESRHLHILQCVLKQMCSRGNPRVIWG